MPRFACIIPNYNTGHRIHTALAALLAQSRPFDDILILDDGSTDDSPAVIERLIAGNPRVRLVKNPRNVGVVDVLNQGLTMIGAEYVHMASANDTYHPRMVEYCERALAEKPDIALFCGNGIFHYKETNHQQPVFMNFPQHSHPISGEAFEAIIRRNPLTFFGGGIVMQRQAVLDFGSMKNELRWHADWALYYLLAFHYGVYFIPEPLVTIEVERGSYSGQARIWQRQRKVIHALIVTLKRDYPAMATRWRRVALLPTYDLRALAMLAGADCRWYISPLLLWRMLIHTLGYWLKYFLPRGLLIKLRGLFRV